MISWLRRSLPFALPLLSFLALPGAAGAQGTGPGATLTFRKVFKSSYPEFVEIKVNESGAGTFDIRQLDEQASPEPLEAGRPLARQMFALAAQLHHFRDLDLEVHRRIANLGQKTFRWEKDGKVHEVTFNYTLNAAAAQLLGIFEGLARQEGDLGDLRRTMRYDRLGVYDVLLHMESDVKNKVLPEPRRLLPTLDELAANEKFLEIAREHARALAERIRNPR